MGMITDRQMQAKATSNNQWLTEDAPKGHGRFMGRIAKSGERFFYFRYTDSRGQRVFLPLGAYDPRGVDGLTLALARTKAGSLSKLYQSGITNLKEHLKEEEHLAEARRAAELAQRTAEQDAQSLALAAEAARLSVTDLFERWALVDLIRRKDGGREIRRMFYKDVLPKIGSIHVEDVRKGDIADVTDVLLSRGVERMAKVVFSLMRQMFRFAVDRDLIERDPTSAIRKAKIGGRTIERDRVLSDDELQVLWKQVPLADLAKTTELAIWIALSTCCRIGELLKARWEHVRLDSQEWYIPSDNSKNGRPHTVYLSSYSVKKFIELKFLTGSGDWCYPNRSGSDHVCVKTITKQLVDRQREQAGPMSRRSKKTQSLLLSGGKWTPHDLRRTGATMMVSLGVIPEVAERCLNHTEENRIKRTYQRHSYEKEMRDAWGRLGDRLLELQ